MYKSPDGWMQYTETWSVQTLMSMIGRGQLLFDWDKQRGYMWNNVSASLFIHSLINHFDCIFCVQVDTLFCQ